MNKALIYDILGEGVTQTAKQPVGKSGESLMSTDLHYLSAPLKRRCREH